jgi:hypothetical protein
MPFAPAFHALGCPYQLEFAAHAFSVRPGEIRENVPGIVGDQGVVRRGIPVSPSSPSGMPERTRVYLRIVGDLIKLTLVGLSQRSSDGHAECERSEAHTGTN